MKLTDLLNEIERLDTVVTKGPWTYDAYIGTDDYDDPDRPFVEPTVKKPDGYDIKIYVPSDYGNTNDAQFIALARTALPLLAAYVKKYLEINDRIIKHRDLCLRSNNSIEIANDAMKTVQDIGKALEWSPEGKE